MAYQNVPVADGYQVAEQIANFASVVGWTVHRSGEQVDIDGSTVYYEVTLSAPDYPCHVTVAGYTNSIKINGHRDYDSNKRWWEQPDQYLNFNDDSDVSDNGEEETTAVCRLRVNPILSVYLFGNMSPVPYLYVAVEKEPGYYRHIVIGHLEKFGEALGGMFWDVSTIDSFRGNASFPSNHRPPLANVSHADDNNEGVGGFDTQTQEGGSHFNRFGNISYSDYGRGGHHGDEINSFMNASPITFNGRTPLQTPIVFANTHTPFGTAPGMRYISLEFFEAGDELVIGDETWKVFPWARRADGDQNSDADGPGDEASGMYGIAYLKE